MKYLGSMQPSLGLGVAEHVGGDPLADVGTGADAVDGLLHLAVAAVAALHRVGRGRQERIVQERQGFFEVRREEFAQRLPQILEAAHAAPQPGQFGQGGVGPTAAVKQAIDLVHDLPKRSQGGQAAGDPSQGLLLGGRPMMLDEQMAMVKQVGDLLFEAFLASGQSAVFPRRPAAAKPGQRAFKLPADLGDGLQDGFREFRQDVELADLMFDRAEDLDDGCRIQRRAVGRDALEGQAAGGEGLVQTLEESPDVLFGGVVVEDLVDQASEAVVVDDRQDAVRPVVEFVGGNVAGEVGQGGVEIVSGDALFGPFFPPLPPSSESWRRGRTRGGLATGARTQTGTAGRPRPPGAPPGPRRDGYSDCWGRPGPTDRH